jgi:serine/threonine-protein kinase HipA
MHDFDFNDVKEQLFEIMRILGLYYPDAGQHFRRMVLNVLARNCDDHSKNFAFIMDMDGKWGLRQPMMSAMLAALTARG